MQDVFGGHIPPVVTVSDLLRAGLELHRRGDLAGAITLYERILQLHPDNGDALMARGVARLSIGELKGAAQDFGAVVAINPQDGAAHNNLGIALARQGGHVEAIASYSRAVEVNPLLAEAFRNRGESRVALNQFEAAIDDLKQALALQPDMAPAFKTLARAFRHTGQVSIASDVYRQAIRIDPSDIDLYAELAHCLSGLHRWAEALVVFDALLVLMPEAAEVHYRRANVLYEQGRHAEALEGYDSALALDASLAMAHCNRAQVLTELERDQEALESAQRAQELGPDLAQAHTNLAVALRFFDRFDEALASCERALELLPNASTFTNKGATLLSCGRLEAASEALDRALGLEPDLVVAHKYKGFIHLLRGQDALGWREMEWRKRGTVKHGVRADAPPSWTGVEDLSGKTLFVHAEQGLGDTLQFCRLLANVHALGAKVIFSCQDVLHPLMASLDTPVIIIGEKDLPAHADYSAALMSLPGLLGLELGASPGPLPYLHAAPERVERWRQRLGGGFKIGVSWKGSHVGARAGKTFRPEQLAGIASLPGVRLISLQKGESAPARTFRLPMEELGPDLDRDGAFLDTAAIMQNLDLVISTDTSIAHLAGALHRSVWVALRHAADWRWLIERNDSPWYPTMKLFRQPRSGDWDSVFAQMEAELTASL